MWIVPQKFDVPAPASDETSEVWRAIPRRCPAALLPSESAIIYGSKSLDLLFCIYRTAKRGVRDILSDDRWVDIGCRSGWDPFDDLINNDKIRGCEGVR